MFDKDKIDSYFNTDLQKRAEPAKKKSGYDKRTRIVRMAKLLFPSIAAVLIGTLLIFPSLKHDIRDLKLDITRPKKEELEKLHVENTVLYVTNKDNQVNNFTARNIDEIEPGSKIIKLSFPEGMLPVNLTGWVNLKSLSGYFDQSTNIIQLTDSVEMFYNEGVEVHTDEVFYDFNQEKGYSNSPVAAEGIFGTLLAEGFEFTNKDNILTFTGHNDIVIHEESLKDR